MSYGCSSALRVICLFPDGCRVGEKRHSARIHQIAYGRTLAMMDRDDEALREINKGFAMPNRDADDPDSKARGRATFNEL